MADSDVLKKDWITTVIATSAILLTIVVGAIAFVHSTIDRFWWPLLVVDLLALSTVTLFLAAAWLGLDALGALIFDVESAEKNNKAALKTKTGVWARGTMNLFRGGLIASIVTGVAAVTVLYWDASTDESDTGSDPTDAACVEWRIACNHKDDWHDNR